MVQANAYSVYKNNSVNYASKDQLLLMIIDGAVKFSKIGRQAILDKDVLKAHQNIMKAENIFYELKISLDVSLSGKWGKDLIKVYDYIIDMLTEANIKKDVKIMDDLMPIIEDVSDTWHKAYELSKGVKE